MDDFFHSEYDFRVESEGICVCLLQTLTHSLKGSYHVFPMYVAVVVISQLFRLPLTLTLVTKVSSNQIRSSCCN